MQINIMGFRYWNAIMLICIIILHRYGLELYFRDTGIALSHHDADIAGGGAFEPVCLQFVRRIDCSFVNSQELASDTG